LTTESDPGWFVRLFLCLFVCSLYAQSKSYGDSGSEDQLSGRSSSGTRAALSPYLLYLQFYMLNSSSNLLYLQFYMINSSAAVALVDFVVVDSIQCGLAVVAVAQPSPSCSLW
jgi:hypothetical protein